MTPIDLVREQRARTAARRTYVTRHHELLQQGRDAMQAGWEVVAEELNAQADLCWRAAVAEMRDPEDHR